MLLYFFITLVYVIIKWGDNIRTGYVYGIKYIPENSIVYVGCTLNLKERIRAHFYFREDKHQPIQVFIRDNGGKNNFEVIVLEEKEVEKTSELYPIETEYIHKFDTFNNGLNGNIGGDSVPFGDKNTNARKVLCVTTGETFNTVKDASKKYELDYSDLSSHLTGRKYLNGIGARKHGVSLEFRYIGRKKDTREISIDTRRKMSKSRTDNNTKKLKDLNTGKIYNSLKDFCYSNNYAYTSVSAHVSGSRVLKKYNDINIEYL